MRPRFQRGQIKRHGASWVLVVYEDQANGNTIERVRVQYILAPYALYPYKKTEVYRIREELSDKVNSILDRVNRTGSVGVTLTLGEFIQQSYFPRLDFRLTVPTGNELHIERSTVDGYKDIWKVHVKNSAIARIQLRNLDSRIVRNFLESRPQNLSHLTHLRIKSFLSGVFAWAIQDGAFHGTNPVDGVKVGGERKRSSAHLTVREKKIRESNRHAYTLDEVADMLEKLPEPARTVCAVAAFTGLTRSELRGLKWDDFDGEYLNVQRKVWATHVGDTKTEARETGVYIIPVLRKIIAKYKKDFPSVGDGWVFRGEKLYRPLDLDNLSRRDIPEYIDGAWFGWHAFRRGLGTRLNDLGVDDKNIQSILRHANVSTTQAFYILPNRERAEAGMRKLDKTLQTKYGIKG